MEFPETLIRLIQFPTKDTINIITKEIIYPINKSLAASISPLFWQTIKANPMLKEIYFPVNENIREFFEGKSIDRELFLRMSIILNNKELIKKWKEENETNIGNVIDHLKYFIKHNTEHSYISIEDMKEEIEFISEHFEELEKEIERAKIPSEYLSEIVKKAKGIKSEEKIKQYILKQLKEEDIGYKRKKLIESIELRGLNNEDIKELIENVKYEDLSEELFSNIKQNILSYLKQEEIEKNNEREKQDKEEILLKKFEEEYLQDSDYKKYSISQLHFAAKKNSKEIGELLISKGADINAIDIIYQIIKILFLIKII